MFFTILLFFVVFIVGFGLGFFVCRNMSANARNQVEKKINKFK